MIQEWLLHHEYQNRSAATTETRRVFTKNFLWFLKQRGFAECGLSELRQFFHYLRSGHEELGWCWGNPRLNKPLRPVSIKDYYNCLRTFFEWAVAENILSESPLERVIRPQAREEIKQPLSTEQSQALLRAAKLSTNPYRDEAMLLMLLDSGVRASELIGIRVGDVDLKANCFEVTGKGNKKRMCYLSKQTAKALLVYLRKTKLPPTASLFPSTRGNLEPMTRSGLLQLIKRLAKAAGFPRMGINCAAPLRLRCCTPVPTFAVCAISWGIPTSR